MRYSIITPTLLRPALKRLCDSIDNQTYEGWEHIVVVDTLDLNEELIQLVDHPQRTVIYCDRPHCDWASTCRRSAWDVASGDYLLFIDDDNYLACDDVLESLLTVKAPVALFPLLYRGEPSPVLPVAVGRSDTNQLMVLREIGQWPESLAREADGVFIERLTREHEWEVVCDEKPLVVYEDEGGGR